jgi:hypothetical protein
VDEAGLYARAVVLAENRLAVLGRAEPVEPGERTGRFDDTYGWRLSAQPAAVHENAIAGESAFPLIEVSLTVFWRGRGGTRQVTLSTFRLGDGGR